MEIEETNYDHHVIYRSRIYCAIRSWMQSLLVVKPLCRTWISTERTDSAKWRQCRINSNGMKSTIPQTDETHQNTMALGTRSCPRRSAQHTKLSGSRTNHRCPHQSAAMSETPKTHQRDGNGTDLKGSVGGQAHTKPIDNRSILHCIKDVHPIGV
jgi:hypothetical protein